jgi:hypothetical protein
MTAWRMSLHAGYLRLPTRPHNMLYLFLFYCNNGCINSPHCYVIGTLPVMYFKRNLRNYHIQKKMVRYQKPFTVVYILEPITHTGTNNNHAHCTAF